MSHLFTKEDQIRAEREMDCIGYCIGNANQHHRNTEFEKAAVYHENIARSLRELQHMKNKKKAQDQEANILLQIEFDQEMEHLIRKLRSRI